jgi:hypothetical protein
MARLTLESIDVPADLVTFVPRRWIKAALDESDSFLASLASQLTRTEVHKHWYANVVIAPARYRAALWEAIGEAAGERHFRHEMDSPKVRRHMIDLIGKSSEARVTPKS